MSGVIAPDTGLELFDLSHPWGYNTPMTPGYDDIKIARMTSHAKFGVLTQKFTTIMHASTHLNAPLHLIPGARGVGDIPLDVLFGNGVVLNIPKTQWELVTAEDLASSTPAVREGDLVIINTGWHRNFSDSQEYFGRSPGLAPEAAQWLIERRVSLVGMDTAAIDHPLATSLGEHRNGPQMKHLASWYRQETGRDPKVDFPDWNPAHRMLLEADIPTVENVGGDVALVSGRRVTLHACPWDWPEGDACVIRLAAIVDPGGSYRIETGVEAGS
jgi:kynurenine formamidase